MSNGLAIFGAVTGGLGLAVSMLVYLRDAPRVLVTLSFDWTQAEYQLREPDGDDELLAVIQIANVGRRAVYLTHAHIPAVVRGGQALIWNGTI